VKTRRECALCHKKRAWGWVGWLGSAIRLPGSEIPSATFAGRDWNPGYLCQDCFDHHGIEMLRNEGFELI